MLERMITGALVALTGFAMLPATQSNDTTVSTSNQVATLHHDLADAIEQVSQNEKMIALADQLEGIQYQQNELLESLDKIAQAFKKTESAKFVSKTDLDDALETAKETIVKTKEFSSGCDCNCLSKLDELEKRIATLEGEMLKTLKTSSTVRTGGGGSTGSYSTSTVQYAQPAITYSTQSTTTQNGGSTGSYTQSQYVQPAPMAVELPDRTRTVKVVEPRTRRNVTYAEVPETADVDLTVQAAPQQCYTDESGNTVCPQTASPTVRSAPSRGWKPGSILFGRR